MLTPADRYASAVMIDDPIAYWRFDEASTIDEADDHAGTYPGTYEALVGREDPGLMVGSRAISIPDLTGQNPVHMFVTNPPLFYINQEPFTLEAWIRPDVIDGDTHGIANIRASGVGGFRWYMTAGGRVRLARENNSMGSAEQVDGNTQLVQGEVHHIAVVYDGVEILHYLDGVPDGSGLSSYAVPTIGGGDFIIGSTGMVGNANARFGGIIDDVAIYDRAIEGGRIAAHFAAGLGDD